MFKILLIGTVLVLFVGPIRRWFFAGAWRYILPLIVGVAAGPFLVGSVIRMSMPPLVKTIVVIFASLLIASGLMGVLNEIFGPPKKR